MARVDRDTFKASVDSTITTNATKDISGADVNGAFDDLADSVPFYNEVVSRQPVRVATTAAGTLATSFENGDTVDGITLATGDRILIKDQSSASENGYYTVNASGAPTRATDMDSSDEVILGQLCYVKEGTANGGKYFYLSNPTGTITLGSSNLTFSEIANDTVFADDEGFSDDSGNEYLKFRKTSTAVNYFELHNSATADELEIVAAGDDTNIDIHITPKGTGKIQVDHDLNVVGIITENAEVDNLNSGTSKTITWDAGNFHKITMTGNCTFTFTAPAGPTTLTLKMTQDGTGSRTATWPASVKWESGTAPTLSTAASAVDLISFYFDGSDYYGFIGKNMS